MRGILFGLVPVLILASRLPAESDQLNQRHNVRVYHQTSLSVSSLTPADDKTVVMSYAFPQGELKAGETLLVLAELQGIDAGSTANPLFTGHVYLGKQATYLANEDNDDTEITENNGQNLAPGSNYQLLQDTHIRVGTFKIRAEDEAENRFVNVMARVDVSAGNSAQINLQQSGSKLTICALHARCSAASRRVGARAI